MNKLNSYTLLSLLGIGGMSKVYLAQDTKTGKKVAVKILNESLSSDPQYIIRFKREAEISKTLSHPNIVKILSYGKDGQRYYIVYEHIEGKTLDKYIKHKKLTQDKLKEIILSIIKGLSYAHSKDIIHRDIKPSNIMISSKEEVKILDFGIARAPSRSTITKTGMFMGSPHYTSPEQIEGNDIDKRTDIYSLGIVIYEMVTGKVPFQAETPLGFVRAHLDKPVPKIKKNIPEYLRDIIYKCLEKNPEDRFLDVGEIKEVIERIRIKEGETVIKEIPNVNNARMHLSDIKRFGIAIGVTVAVLVLFVIFWFVFIIPKPTVAVKDSEERMIASEVEKTEKTEINSSSIVPIDEYKPSPQDKVILTQPSVCFITTYFWGYVLDPWDNIWSSPYYWAFVGTGFCVNPDSGYIITAGSIIEISVENFRYDLIYAYLTDTYGSGLDNWTDDDWNWAYNNIKVEGYNGGDYDLEIYVQFNTANANIPDNPNKVDAFNRAELIDYSSWDQKDIAIIRTQPQAGRALSSAIVEDSSNIDAQDQLTIIGYPWASDIDQNNLLNPTITYGSLSGQTAGTEVMQMQVLAREGNNGGPVLDKDGGVVGMITMGVDYTNYYFRPSNDIKEMLSINGAINSLGEVDEEFMQGLVNYRQKHYSKAIEHFNTVLNLNQRHLLSQEYRSKSQEAIERGEDILIEDN